MKKILLCTTALVVAGFAAASAPAQAQTQPFGSPNFAVTVGGFARQAFGYTSQTNVAAQTRSHGFDEGHENRLNLTFRAAIPNGMSAGATWNLNPNNNTATGNGIVRRAFSFIEGSFGQVQVGATEGVTNQMNVYSYDAFGGGAGLVGAGGDVTVTKFFTNGVGLVLPNQAGTPGNGGDGIDGIANKIIYFTPRIEGFQLGVSYAPTASHRQGFEATNTQYLNGRNVALNFTRTFDAVAVRASAAYATWDAPSGVGLTDVQKANYKDPSVYNFGAGIAYMGFDIGGAYMRVKDAFNNTAGTTTVAAALGTTQIDGNAWEAGIGYKFGAAGVSVNYASAKNKAGTLGATGLTAQNGGDDKAEIWGASGTYLLAPGVNVSLGLFTVKYTEGTLNTAGTNASLFSTAQSSRANGAISALHLVF